MNQTEIFGPMLAMFVLTAVVWVVMYARRLPFVFSGDYNPDRGTALELDMAAPVGIVQPSDNLKNLFELPVIFYALVLMLFVTHQVDSVYLAAAWVFAGFRVAHSLVHCTVNIVMLRFPIYVVSAGALWFMVGRAAANYFHWL